MSSSIIKCDNCGNEVDVNNVIYQEIENKLNKEHKQEIANKRAEYKKAFDELKTKEQSLQETISQETKKQLSIEKQKMQTTIKQELENEQKEQLQLLNNELNDKSNKLKEFNKSKAEIEKLKREKEEIGDELKAKYERELNQTLKEEKQKIQELSYEENQRALKEKDVQIEQMQKKVEDANKIAKQGSMQVQGEAQELSIEDWLRQEFKYDIIEEVKKGAFGADCKQIVQTRDLLNCGIICYESKQTKTWSDGWISKLKKDMISMKADISVLVSTVMPKDISKMGFYDGVWVCGVKEFRGSVALLRDALIKVHKTKIQEENKTDKMSLLYNYLTSNEFMMQFEVIVNGFMKMQEELDKEKRSMQASWKRRQKIIDGVVSNTTEIHGSLQGIAGNSIGNIKALELSYDEDE